MKPHNATLLLVALLLPVALQAGVYRWVDENGVTVYSQTPPPNDTPTIRMKTPPPPPPAEAGDTLQTLENKLQQIQDQKDIHKEQELVKSEQEKIEQDRERNCDAGRHNLEILRGSTRKLIETPDGKFHRLTAEERQSSIEEAEAMIAEFCN